MSTIREEKAMKRVADYCAESEQCRASASKMMKKWGFSNKMIEGILEALETSGFINEDRYSRCFVNDKFRLNKWGRVKIAQALALRNIPETTYQPYLNDIDEDEYMATLKHLIHTKMRSIQGKTEEERENKLIRYAVGRGFEMRYIRQCLNIPEDD
jgi:regulatory protein